MNTRNVAVGGLAASAVVAGILLSAALIGSRAPESHADAPTAGSPSAAVPVQRIVHLLRAESTQFGDPHPTAMGYVRVTRGSVISYISGATLDPRTKDAPVVLARARGRFAEQTRGIAGPLGDAVFRGPAIDLIIDLQTGKVLTIGIDPAPIALATLGPVVRLPG
jgi:hypothetical protein